MLRYIKLTFVLAFFFFSNYSAAQRLLWVESANDQIRVANITPTGIGTASVYGSATGLTNPNSLAIDANRNFIFYSENFGEDLIQADYIGSSPFPLITTGAFAGYQDVAYSEIASGIYAPEMNGGIEFFVESTGTRIVMNLGGNNHYFTCVTVDDGAEVIYAYDQDDDAIYRSDFSDVGLTIIVAGTNSVQVMNFDERTNTLYFIDGSNILWSCDANGGGLVSHGSALPGSTCTSMQVYSQFGKVYYIMDGNICSVNVNGSSPTTLISLPAAGVTDLAIEADITPPGVSILTPLDGAVTVSGFSNLVIAFDENVKISSTSGTLLENSILIFKTVGNIPIDTISRADANVSIVGTTATIDPDDKLLGSTDYYILVGSKVFSDLSGNDFGGISSATTWNFTTDLDPTKYYSRQNTPFIYSDPNSWTHDPSHIGVPATDLPGSGSDAYIGAGHTMILTGDIYFEANIDGLRIEATGTLDADGFTIDIAGTLDIIGSLLNPGIITNTFGNAYIRNTSGNLLIIDQLIIDSSFGTATLYTDIVVLNGYSVISGTLNTNGFNVCDATTAPPVTPVFTNKKSTSVTLSWTKIAPEDAFIVARQGSTAFKPAIASLYNANTVFGSGDAVGAGNFVVYKGPGTSVDITGLLANSNYEFDMYSYSTIVGGCYNINNYQFTSLTSCGVMPAPTNPVNASYCAGDAKPAINVDNPGSGRNINWYDAATAGNVAPGDVSGSARNEIFIPTAASGTFYAEIYDGTTQCTSDFRTAVTLTLNPAVTPGAPGGTQNVCVGDDPTVLSGGTATGGDGTYTYQWESATASTTGPYTNILGATLVNYDPPAGILQTTHYRVRVTSSTCTSQTGNFISVTIGSPVDVTGLINAPGDAQITLNWTNPASCFDEVLIIGKQGGVPASTPIGDGTAYTASAVFGSGTAVIPNEFVVYKGSGTNVVITGLTNSISYSFKIFTRKGIAWSSGTITSGTGIPTPPIITFTPTNGATNIVVTANLTIAFNEPIRNIDNSVVTNANAGALVSLKLNNAAGANVPFTATINGTMNLITIDPSAALLPSQLYYLSIAPVEDSNNNATITSSITFTTQAGPSITNIAPLAVCVGQSVTITGTNFGTATPTVSINSINIPVTGHTATSITVAPTAAASGVVSVTNNDIPLGTVSSSTLTISTLPNVFSVTGGGSYCVGSNGVTIGLSNSQSGVEYEVYLGAVATGVKSTPGGGAFNFAGFFTAAGTYSVKGKNTGNCSSDMSGTAVVQINNLPSGIGSISSSTVVMCQDGSLDLTAQGFVNALTYEWILPAGLSTTSSTSGNTITIIGDAAPGGLISVKAKNNCGLSSAATLSISVNPLPVVSIEAPPANEQIIDDELQFTSTVDLPVTAYAWSFGDGETSSEENPQHTYTSQGTFNVSLSVKTTTGCVGTASVDLAISEFPVLSTTAIKNVVTANEDGKNDRLIVVDIERFPNNTVSVIDRWGVEVYNRNAYNNEWDFKKGGNYLPVGNYICIVKLNDSGKVITRTVTLVKK